MSHRVVVLGAGYTGMLCAVRLARRTRRMDVQIVLVNPSGRFRERMRLHQAVTGQRLAEHRIGDLVEGTGIVFEQGRATGIDTDARTVALDAGQVLTYDTLVYALGSRTDLTRVPGAAEHAFGLDSAGLAGRIGAARSVVVCGGGLTGLETAAELAESRPDLAVTLVSSAEPGAMMGDRARAYTRRVLDRLGVAVRSGVPVGKVLPDAVRLADGEILPADVTIWTAGVVAPPLAADSGIAVDEQGRVLVDTTLASVSHPGIYAVGDAAAVRMTFGVVHGTCQSGLPTAAHVADAIHRALRGKAAKPFRFGYVHQPVSLGRRAAVIQFTHADDTPRRAYLKGRAAVRYKSTVTGSPVPIFKLSRRVSPSVALARGGRATMNR